MIIININKLKINALNISLFFIILSINQLKPPAFSGVLESQAKFQKNVINQKLTLERIRELEAEAVTSNESALKLNNATKQKVFWVGYIDEFYSKEGYSFIHLRINNDYVWALADDTVRNLDFNREGYKVGIKGSIVLNKNNRLDYLDVWSIILFKEPTKKNQFSKESQKENNNTFLINNKTVKIDSLFLPYFENWIKMHNPNYPDELTEKLSKSIIYYSQLYKVDPRLMLALFTVESAMDIDAVSWSGAIGIGQLMPGTASGLGVNPYNFVENVNGATKYLSSLMKMWAGKSDPIGLSLASYNAGPGNVTRSGGIPSISETVNYVYFIKYLYREICRETKDL